MEREEAVLGAEKGGGGLLECARCVGIKTHEQKDEEEEEAGEGLGQLD